MKTPLKAFFLFYFMAGWGQTTPSGILEVDWTPPKTLREW
jgi:hypothetical protein